MERHPFEQPVLRHPSAAPVSRWAERPGVEQIAARVLLALTGRLDQCLQHPLLVLTSPEQRAVLLFGSHSFVVYRDTRSISAPEFVRSECDFQLWPFLSRREWRKVLAAELQHVGAEHLARLRPALRRRVWRWAIATCLRLLGADRRFWQLRHERVIEALGFDPTLVSIALRARIPGDTSALTCSHFLLVWRNERMYRRVADENPRLLAMVTAMVQDKPIEPDADAIAVLANRMKAEVSPRAWRFLARHGSRVLHLPWQSFQYDVPIGTAAQYLRLMDAAGCPPPLPPRLTRAWLSCAMQDLFYRCPPSQRWLQPHVLACASRLAEATRAHCVSTPSVGEFVRVAQWASTHLPKMDKHQRAGGWRWLERQQQRQARLGDSSAPDADRWASAIGAFQYQEWLVEPLLTSHDVLLAKTALRNCLEDYLEDLRVNRARFFAIRDTRSHMLVGAIGMWSDPCEPGEWRLIDVKGVANRPAPQWRELAAWLVSCYGAAERTRPAGDQLFLDLDMPPVPRIEHAAAAKSSQRLLTYADDDIPF